MGSLFFLTEKELEMKWILKGVDPPRTCQECPCFHQIAIQKKVGQYCMAAKQIIRKPKRIFEINLAVDDWTSTEIPEWCPGEGVN